MKKKEIIQEIKNMIKKYPNDIDLGNYIRSFFINLKIKKNK
mgnify:CR=1 FL=1